MSESEEDFDRILAEPLPIPSPPEMKDDVMPKEIDIVSYRNALYDYYIQYYARFYLTQLRATFRQYNSDLPIPTTLSTLPTSAIPEGDVDLDEVKTDEQLKAFCNRLHFSFNFQSSQVYQKWYADQLAFISYQSSQNTSQSIEDGPQASSTPPVFQDYAASAYFNKKTSRFQPKTSEEHWTSQGLSTDRAGRQLSRYLDMSGYEEERRTIKKKKPQKQSAKYWKEKKAEKKHRRLVEFLKD